jgi:hypothetical protein
MVSGFEGKAAKKQNRSTLLMKPDPILGRIPLARWANPR